MSQSMNKNTDIQLTSISLPFADALLRQSAEIGANLQRQDIEQTLQSVNEGDNTRAENLLAALDGLFLDEELTITAKKSSLKKLNTPCMIRLDNGNYVVVTSVSRDKVTFAAKQNEQVRGEVSLTYAAAQSQLLGHRKSLEHAYLRKSLTRLHKEQKAELPNAHWFWSVFKQEQTVFNQVLIASLFANLLAAVSSFFSLQVYDRVIPNQSEETLWALLIGVLMAFTLEAVLRIVRANLLDYSGKKIDVQSTALLLRRLMGLRLSHQTPSPNHLNQQMREFNSVREFFTEAAVGSLVDIPFAFLFLFIIYLLGGYIVWVPIIAMIVMVLPSLLLRKKMLEIVQSSLGAHAAANRVYNEVSYNLETVKNTGASRFFEQQWNDISYLLNHVSMRQRRLVTFLTQWSATIQQVAFAMTITAAAFLVFEGMFTMGSMIALSILTSRTLAPFARLSTLLIRWQQIRSSLEHLDSIADGEQDDPDNIRKLRREELHGLIQLQKILFSYHEKAQPALNIDRLVIRPGEKIAILGNNGSGKSTLLKLLAGLYLPQQGEIKLDGIDSRQIASKDLRQNIAYNTQEAQLFNGTLRDNLTFGDKRITDEMLIDVLHKTGLSNFLQAHPHGLDLPILDGGSGLSVGQKHSLQLARVFLSNSPIILLDEPTASFDPEVEHHVIDGIRKFTADKTLLVVTHRTPILAMVDRIIVMTQGHIIADGPREEVLNKIAQAQQPNQQPNQQPKQQAGQQPKKQAGQQTKPAAKQNNQPQTISNQINYSQSTKR